MKIYGYGKIYNLGDRRVEGILDGPVSIEEKIDGSQFSFLKDDSGVLHFRSKKVELLLGMNPLFDKSMTGVLSQFGKVPEGYVFRGEALRIPQHNHLRYSRTPRHHVIIWDVHKLGEECLPYDEMKAIAEDAGFEVVPQYAADLKVNRISDLKAFLDEESILGGPIEGIVIKARGKLNGDGNLLAAKFVAPSFREVTGTSKHRGSKNPFKELGQKYCTEARWMKAVQHLRESGELTGTLADIGRLIKEVHTDLQDECVDQIKEDLWSLARKDILKESSKGLSEWYKDHLMGEVG